MLDPETTTLPPISNFLPPIFQLLPTYSNMFRQISNMFLMFTIISRSSIPGLQSAWINWVLQSWSRTAWWRLAIEAFCLVYGGFHKWDTPINGLSCIKKKLKIYPSSLNRFALRFFQSTWPCHLPITFTLAPGNWSLSPVANPQVASPWLAAGIYLPFLVEQVSCCTSCPKGFTPACLGVNMWNFPYDNVKKVNKPWLYSHKWSKRCYIILYVHMTWV